MFFFLIRVRSIRGTWKSLMQERNGDMCECWDAMNNMFILQHCAIRASLNRSTFMVYHRHSIPVYEKLRGHVSKNALNHIVLEYDRMNCIDIEIFFVVVKLERHMVYLVRVNLCNIVGRVLLPFHCR